MTTRPAPVGRVAQWTLALGALLAAVSGTSVHAAVRCNELSAGICLEARSSGVTSAYVAWDDGTFTDLSAAGNFTIHSNGPYESGSKVALFSDYGLQSILNAGLHLGTGPALQVDYSLVKGAGFGTASTSRSYYAGQASGSYLIGSGSLGPALTLNSQSTADFGVNRSSAGIAGTVIGDYTANDGNLIRSGQTGTVHTRVLASAQSYWLDQMTFAADGQFGGVDWTAGAPVSFSVALTGSLDTYGSVIYALHVADEGGQLQSAILQTIDGRTDAGSLSRTLTGTITALPGHTYTLGGDLIVYAESGSVGGVMNAQEVFSDTARVTSIGLPAGLQVTFGSDSPNLAGVVQTVPEPSIWASFAVGLGVAGGAIRRRRR
ncbi:MAG: PEP-CTERM sorting domain-containing protein [Burkholderiales bacterium]